MQFYKTKDGKRIHNQNGTYFLTFTVVNWIDIFTRQNLRNVIIDSIKYCIQNKGLIVHAYVIMSNHIHMICKAEYDNLSDIVRDFKKHTCLELIDQIKHQNESRKDWLLWMFKRNAKRLGRNGYKVWKSGSGTEELYSNKFIDQKLNYIHQNPVTAGIVVEAYHYLYRSAIDYSGGKGMIEVCRL